MPPLLAPVLTLAFCLAVQDRAVDVSVLTLGPPVLVAEIDTSKVKGDAGRLAWEPGGTTLSLQTAEGRPQAAGDLLDCGRPIARPPACRVAGGGLDSAGRQAA
jgi:hypothetical protein